jgi:hypothetical protein
MPKSVKIRTLCQSTPLKNVEKRVILCVKQRTVKQL